MIEASGEGEDEEEEEGVKTECPAHQTPPPKKKGVMTDKEVYSNSIGFLGAGNDTTSVTLAFASYLLAVHPDIQQRLQSEINAYFDEKPVSSYLSIDELMHAQTYYLLCRTQTFIQQLRRSHTLIRWCKRLSVYTLLRQSKGWTFVFPYHMSTQMK